MTASAWTLEVSVTDLASSKIHRHAPPTLHPGDVLVDIEHVALTANTMTYAAMGDALGYWSLYPGSAPGWGCIPAWGHGQVRESRIEGIENGTRLFGLWPMASQALLSGRRSRLGVRDSSPHRKTVNPVYNQYAIEEATNADARQLRAVFHPLFVTSFVLAQHLADQEHSLGAVELVVVSASSKTALGAAYSLQGRRQLVGLTSGRNAQWLTGTGLFESVVPYEALDGLAGTGACVVLDFSSDQLLLNRVTSLLGDRCKRLVRIGATHGGPVGHDASQSKDWPDTVLFSGPENIERYAGVWGPEEFDRRLRRALAGFMEATSPHFALHHFDGEDGTLAAYDSVREGRIGASTLIVARPTAPASRT
jgi:hypothetical protein